MPAHMSKEMINKQENRVDVTWLVEKKTVSEDLKYWEKYLPFALPWQDEKSG
jgi:hypothetical protein